MLEKASETYRELSAAQITTDALRMLKARNCYARRHNNHATRGRRNNTEPGFPDVAGYNLKTGVALFCEVKKNGDILSDDQIIFLYNACVAGCISLVAHQVKSGTQLSSFPDYFMLYYAGTKKYSLVDLHCLNK